MNGEELDRLILERGGPRRFTQDSPVYPDVWHAYGAAPAAPVDLLLTPHERSSAGDLAKALRGRLEAPGRARLAYTSNYATATLTFAELLAAALPLTPWWQNHLPAHGTGFAAEIRAAVAGADEAAGTDRRRARLRWFVRLAGRIAAEAQGRDGPITDEVAAEAFIAAAGENGPKECEPHLWAVSCNRQARTALWSSRQAVKADAACRLFEPDFEGLGWAVIDTGIDAAHPAFRDRSATEPHEYGRAASRVVEAYDFTRMREAQAIAFELPARDQNVEIGGDTVKVKGDLIRALRSGRQVDFELLKPALRVDQASPKAEPKAAHGTHVAGILAADWPADDPENTCGHDVIGVAPGLRLYDLRVLGKEGTGEEYGVLAALAFVRWLNAQSDRMLIHGVNLSLSLDHDVKNFACGRTPVCEEVERLSASGVVVVAAAGNRGYQRYAAADGYATTDGYRAISITDPGNAECVITVGSTHRAEPHAYGVSYFSSRGPTGDGRAKPDVVAPGEKITGPVPGGGLLELDGTSMAAPHVSGAAALLLARHRELIGDPARVKRVLCSSATDLGRTRDFQGAGLVDTLRALQSF